MLKIIKYLKSGPALSAIVAMSIGLFSPHLHAVNFTVNSTVDSVDANPGDGVCETLVANECTLRAAVQESNAWLGADTIELPDGEYVLSIVGFGGAEDGDLDLTDELSIIGQSMEGTIIDGGEMEDGIFHIYGSVSANIKDLTVQNCDCSFGGIRNEGDMSLESVIVRGNRSGINSSTFASATINSSIIEQNNPRGGIGNFGLMSIQNSVISENIEDWDGYGGGIKNLGTMLLDSTTINNNYAGRGGGGIHNRDELSVINSTISGNRADDIYQIGTGGGIYNISFWPTLLYNVTIANNESTRASGIFIGAISEDTRLKNTIIADNIGGVNCEVFGSLTSQGYNLSDDSTCNLINIGDITSTDPLLGALDDNGGLAPTHSLLESSPAIDAGQANCTDLNDLPLLTDQRGEPRPVDGNNDGTIACDIGSYEVQPMPTVIDIDIKPGSDSNPVNPKSTGVIPVAILGSIDFDATQIVDYTTVTFGPTGASPIHDSHVEDVNGDGFMDMLFHFRTQENGIACGDTEATLTGETFDGIQFTGTDTVNTVGCVPSACISPPSGLVSWWPGDGNTDDIAGTNDGERLNGAKFAEGIVGKAFSFDGVDDVVFTPVNGIDGLQQLTIDVWVKHNSLPLDVTERYVTLSGEAAVLRHEAAGGSRQLHFYMSIDGVLRDIRVNDVMQAGVFHHVAGTYNGSDMRLYLDGVEVGSLGVSGTVGASTSVELSSEFETIDGLLDEVDIYNRALTAQEIAAIFDAGDAGKCK